MKLYLSGKITGDPDYKKKFREARFQLEAAGYEVLDPTNFDLPEDVSWEEAMRFDLRKMLCCDAVAVLPDWQDSKGAIIETRLARELGIKVKLVQAWISIAALQFYNAYR